MIKDLIQKHGLTAITNRMSHSLGRRISPQRVNNWLERGVPLDMVLPFCRAVDFEATPHQLSPEIYPHPDDGLPEKLRVVDQQAKAMRFRVPAQNRKGERRAFERRTSDRRNQDRRAEHG